MLISILICSLETRKEQLQNLISILQPQVNKFGTGRIEIIVAVDNKEISTGAKRNKLLQLANGEYVIYIDDDDWVPPYYVKELVYACMKGADCVAINGWMTTDGEKSIRWRLSKDYDNITIKEDGVDLYLRRTNHITAVKREHALKAMFPEISNAEDKGYSDAVNKFLKTEVIIVPEMYHYQYSTKNKQY